MVALKLFERGFSEGAEEARNISFCEISFVYENGLQDFDLFVSLSAG